MLVWLYVILFGSGAVATGLLVYLGDSEKKAAPPGDVVAQSLPSTSKADASSSTQTSDETTPSESGDDKTNFLQQPEQASQQSGNAARAGPAPETQASTVAPYEPLSVAAEKQKYIVSEEPAGAGDDAPREPDPLDVFQEPLSVPDAPKRVIKHSARRTLYADRTKPKTARWLAQRGGTIESQNAVEAGLDWLARHQGADGHWGPDCLGADANSCCDRNALCQGTGKAYEIAQSGLALLAFQAGGHYYFNAQRYSDQVKKGLDYLVENQSPDGSIVGSQNPSPDRIKAGAWFDAYFMYEHSIGTFALCEACAVAIAEGKNLDPRYQAAAQRAVAFIEKVQHDDGGWRYTVDGRYQSDCSVSGWVMLALKTAHEANISVSPRTIACMMDFFAANYADGRTHYQFGNQGTAAMTGVGMMAVAFFEHELYSPVMQKGAAYLADNANWYTKQLSAVERAQILELEKLNLSQWKKLPPITIVGGVGYAAPTSPAPVTDIYYYE